MSDLYTVTITLKSGATVELVVSEFTVVESPITGDTEGYKWTVPNGHPKLLDISLSEVAAIVSRPYEA